MGRRGFGSTSPRVAAGVGTRRRGVCPVCRGRYALRDSDGKMMPHGRTAAAPRGCDGAGGVPLRDATGTVTGAVRSIGAPAVDPDAEAALPEIRIEPREVPAHQRPRPTGGVA